MNQFRSFGKSISVLELTIPLLVKLLVLPIIVVLLVLYFDFEQLITYIVIVQSMMPALTLSSILFAKNARDEKFGAVVTVLSTAVSLLTIPAILYLVNMLG